MGHSDMIDQSKCHCEHDLAAWRCSPVVSAWSLSADQWSVVTSVGLAPCVSWPRLCSSPETLGPLWATGGVTSPGPPTLTRGHTGGAELSDHTCTPGALTERAAHHKLVPIHWPGPPRPPSATGSLLKIREDDVLMNTRNRPAEIKSEWRGCIHRQSGSYSVYLVSCIFKCHRLVYLFVSRENFMNELLCCCREASRTRKSWGIPSWRPLRMSSSHKKVIKS